MCVHAKACLTLCDPMDCGPSGSSVHGVFLARIVKWVVISYSRGSSQPRDQTHVSCISCIADEFLPLSYQGRPILTVLHNTTLKNILCSAYSFLLQVPDLIAVSIVPPFLECQIVVIIQDYIVTFSDWLLSLSIMHVSFFHVFFMARYFFLLSLKNIPLSDSPFTICTFTYEEYLLCFQVWAIMN